MRMCMHNTTMDRCNTEKKNFAYVIIQEASQDIDALDTVIHAE